MKRKMSTKVKWAIGLLIFTIINTFIYAASHFGSAIAVSTISEFISIIAVIVLTFYDHAYKAPKKGNFTLLRIWALSLVWVQPFLSIFSYALAGLFNAVIGYWIGTCIFPAIAFTLLYLDGKNTETITKDHPTEKPWYYNIVAQELEKQVVRNFDETAVKSIWEKANIGGYTDEKLYKEVQTYKDLRQLQSLFPDKEKTEVAPEGEKTESVPEQNSETNEDQNQTQSLFKKLSPEERFVLIFSIIAGIFVILGSVLFV